MHGGRHDQQRVAVRRGVGDRLRTDLARCPGLVFNDDGRFQALGHALGKEPADDIDRAARRPRHDEANRTRGIVILGA